MLRQSRASRRAPWSLWASVVLGVAACGGDSTVPVIEGVIDRETFIETYVDIRAETFGGTETTLSTEERDRILARHGVDAESLLAFVDAYGRDLDFMRDVWAEVERQMAALPAGPADAEDPT